MTINELPHELPMVNLALSVLALVALAIISVRILRDPHSLYTRLSLVVVAAAVLVMIAGAAFQANLIPLRVWGWVGPGGRAVVVIGLLALASVSPPKD